MLTFNLPNKRNFNILALGAESAGNFSVWHKSKITISPNFGDLIKNKNFTLYYKTLIHYLKINKITPNIILTDLHPLYQTTQLGIKLSRKFKAKHISIQHHCAHLLSAWGEQYFISSQSNLPNEFFGIACDGTGLGWDGNIWGGEVLQFKRKQKSKWKIKRTGHLQYQTMIGGDLAIKEPARMLLSILDHFLNKNDIYQYIKSYYNRNQFELLYNQLQHNFNCQLTSSTGRILDAVAILLKLIKNIRAYKHAPVDKLEQIAGAPLPLKPKINYDSTSHQYILQTTHLFQYLVNHLYLPKARLAATAPKYLAVGLSTIIKNISTTHSKKPPVYFAGGLSQNKIITNHFKTQGFITTHSLSPGDASLSFGQIMYYYLIHYYNQN